MSGLHIVPHRDRIDHAFDEDCVCGPDIEFRHPENDEPYHRPVVSHHSVDGRELHEHNWLKQIANRLARRHWIIVDPDEEVSWPGMS